MKSNKWAGCVLTITACALGSGMAIAKVDPSWTMGGETAAIGVESASSGDALAAIAELTAGGHRLTLIDQRGGDRTELASWLTDVARIDNFALTGDSEASLTCLISGESPRIQSASREIVCWTWRKRDSTPKMRRIATGLISPFGLTLLPASGGRWAVWFQEQAADRAVSVDLVKVEIDEETREAYRLSSYRASGSAVNCHPREGFAVGESSNGEWILSHEYCVNRVSWERQYQSCLRHLGDGHVENLRSCAPTFAGPFACSRLTFSGGDVLGQWNSSQGECVVKWARDDLGLASGFVHGSRQSALPWVNTCED